MQLTDADDIELEASLQQLLLDLLGDAVKTYVASWEDRVPLRHCHGHDVGRVLGNQEYEYDEKDAEGGTPDGASRSGSLMDLCTGRWVKE